MAVHIKINDIDPIIQYTASAAQTVFPYPFPIFADADLVVDIDGTTQTLTTNYTVSGAGGDSGGNVTLVTPATGGEIVTIYRDLAVERTTDYQNAGDFRSDTVNTDFDRIVAMIQQTERDIKKSIRVPITDTTSTDDLIIPESRANKYLYFDASGRATVLAQAIGDPATAAFVNVSSFGAVGDGVTDDTASIQAAIDSFAAAGGVLVLPAGTYKVSSEILVNKPIFIQGQGAGATLQPVQLPATKILWAGTAGESVIKFGGFGTLLSGGGISDLMIDGAAVAGVGLHIKDSQRGSFNRLTITGASQNGILMENSAIDDPTGFAVFEDIRIQLRGGATDSANGLYINGTNTSGAEGVTLCTFVRVRIEHANGHGVVIGDIGDYCHWEALQTFRADVEAGIGVHFESAGSPSICNYHTFDSCNASAGWFFLTAGRHQGTRITNAGEIDINPGITILRGAGASEVMFDSGLGYHYGQGLLPNFRHFNTVDRMTLIRHDTTNNVLHTANGNWRTALVGAGTLTESGQPGTGTRFTTGAVTNDAVTIYDAATLGGDGISGLEFVADFLLSPITITNCRLIIGFVDQDSATPNNGMYFQFDPSVSAFWQIKTRASATETSTTTALSGAVGKIELYMHKNGEGVSFYFRTSSNRLFGFMGTHTTNVPTASLYMISRIETLTTANALFDIYGAKLGVTDEVPNI